MIKKVLRSIKHTIRSKLFPCRLDHWYSQEGEDMILARIFEGKATGFYVDVGAYHPTRFSNTYHFYLRGWRGLNLDAMPGSMAAFQKTRPRDMNVEKAVAETPGKLLFHIFNQKNLNTFDPELARERAGWPEARIMEVKEVECLPLSRILADAGLADQPIDFMSVDVEGLDLEVLRSNDWKRFTPTYVLAEDYLVEDVEHALQGPTAQFLYAVGYVLFAKTAHTLIFKKKVPNQY